MHLAHFGYSDYDYLEKVTDFLVACRREDPLGGMWDAGDLQWWWREDLYGDPANQTATFDVWVPGGPWATPLYRCDFEPTAGETSLEDFGWTVVNGGGNDLTGENVNKWEYIGFIYGAGAATLSAFWGDVDPGPDVVGTDSSEVLDEYII